MTPVPANPRKIRVLVVDDSAIVRKLVSDALNAQPDIEVVATAIDPYIARDKILAFEPDVLTLDIEMPRMDGITFLRILMKHRPLPVIIMSSLSQAGSKHALDALESGAVDVMAKPGGSYSVGDLADELVRKVRAAAVSRRAVPSAQSHSSAPAAAAPAPVSSAPAREWNPRQIVLLGASTGGTEALKEVITRLPAAMPGICIVQHIPAYFSHAFAERLNTLSALEVREARDGDMVRPGLALVAPGDYHMLLRRRGDGYGVQLKQGPKIWHQRPAVDALFQSAAEIVEDHAVAGVLTGMGQDGAEGLLKLREVGSRTFAQDEKTCVVFGMPRVAMERGAAERMVALPDIAGHLQFAVNERAAAIS
jgi:two-component system chemotaxis response regulator CheB